VTLLYNIIKGSEDLHWKWSLVKFIGMWTFQSSC